MYTYMYIYIYIYIYINNIYICMYINDIFFFVKKTFLSNYADYADDIVLYSVQKSTSLTNLFLRKRF